MQVYICTSCNGRTHKICTVPSYLANRIRFHCAVKAVQFFLYIFYYAVSSYWFSFITDLKKWREVQLAVLVVAHRRQVDGLTLLESHRECGPRLVLQDRVTEVCMRVLRPPAVNGQRRLNEDVDWGRIHSRSRSMRMSTVIQMMILIWGGTTI